MHKKSGTCITHGDAFARVHGRVDALEVDMTKVNITLFGDASKNIEGFLQMNIRFQDKVKIDTDISNKRWRTQVGIWTTMGVGVAAMLIKLFFFMPGVHP